MRAAPWASAALIAAAAALALARTRPPAARGADAPPAEFSAARAFEHVRRIAVEPHPAGSKAQEPVRRYLVERLRALGLEPEVSEASVEGARYSGPIRNVVARRAGTASTGAVLLVAHYDSVPAGPGAADDASSVAAILESLRALDAGPPPRNDVLVLLSDGEEMGLVGAAVFARDPDRLRGVRVVLNFETRGNAGPTLMFETSASNARLIEAYASVAPRPGANSLMGSIYRRMPNDTDFSVFRQKGLAGLNFAFIEGHTAYHMPADTAGNLSLDSLQHQGETLLAVLRRFGAADLADLSGDDTVYFDLLGTWVVRYPTRLAWRLTAAALLLFAFVVLRCARAGLVRAPGAFAGGGLLLASTVVSCAASFGVSRAVLWLFAEHVSRPAKGTAADPWLYAGIACLTLAFFRLACRRLGARLTRAELAVGSLAVWLLLLLAAQVLLVEGTFLFLVPLVLGTAALGLRTLRAKGAAVSLLAALAGALAALVVAPMVQRFYVAMTLERPYVATALLALFLGALVPCLPAAAQSARE